MHAVEDVIAQTVRTERAAVAHAVIENIPGVGQLAAVFPKNAEHLAIVLRLGLTDQTERHEARKQGIVGFNGHQSLGSGRKFSSLSQFVEHVCERFGLAF